MTFTLRQSDAQWSINASAAEMALVRRTFDRLRGRIEKGERLLAPGPGRRSSFSEDTKLNADLAASLGACVDEQKSAQLESFAGSLPKGSSRTVRVSRKNADAWLGCLNDLRLMLAEELGIVDGRPTPPVRDARDERLGDWVLYDILTQIEVAIVYDLDGA
jgi:hypothetical protein